MSNFGYIQIEFEDEFKKLLVEWSNKSIDKKSLIYGEINGEQMGGLVAQDAHVTLIYGVPIDTEYSEEIQQEIKKIVLPKIKISGVSCFHIKEYGAKVLYLSINDDSGVLKQIHEKFRKFISEELQQNQPQFVPHIAIAYVSESFNEQALIYGGPYEIHTTSIKYYQ